MDSLERLLTDLSEKAKQCPHYSGTIERYGDGFRLRYFPPSEKPNDLQKEHNRAVRELDQIAPRILVVLKSRGQTFPANCETDGAAVMVCVLADRLKEAEKSQYQRASFSPVGNPFEAIRERLLLVGDVTHRDRTDTEAESVRSPPDYQSSLPLVSVEARVPSASECEDTPGLQPFTGGEIVFHPDRVDFWGVDICSGTRSKTKRRILDLLRLQNDDGTFVAYSGEQLAKKLKLEGAVAGLIRDLRDEITKSLRNKANIDCGRNDVILSGGRGYRFSENLNVQFVTPPHEDSSDTNDVNSVGDDGVGNVGDRVGNVGDRVGDLDVGEVSDDLSGDKAVRCAWILEQLTNGSR